MELYSIPFHPNNSHIHCLAHVVNLVVQKMLSVAKNVDELELQDYYKCLNKQFLVHYDLNNDDKLCKGVHSLMPDLGHCYLVTD